MKNINQYILEIKRLPLLNDYLIEAQVDGLKDVTTIRHYTTGAGLKSILKDGYIEARESKGDEDWEAYDLLEKKVVSFHDKRTDPEWDTFIKANNRGISMEGTTPTLGLHDKKVCACIEIEYDKLDKLIQDRTHLLNIYDKKAEEFCNLWNEVIDRVTNDKNGFIAFYGCKLDFAKFVKQVIEGDDDKMRNSLKFIWDEYHVEELAKREEGKLAFEEIEKIFLKHYPKEELYKEVKDYLGSKKIFIYYETSRYIGWGFPSKYDEKFLTKESKSAKQVDNTIADLEKQLRFYNRANLKIFTNDEIQEMAMAAVKFDVVKIIKMMHNHGWQPGDLYIGTLFTGYRRKNEKGKYVDHDLMLWIDCLLKNPKKIVNANIEIRIGSNVELNKENCKIIIFNGICDATKQSDLKSLPKKYYDKYNIQHM